MPDERQQRLMQEALDEQMTREALEMLHRQLDWDPDAAAQFNRLKRVDEMLRNAPYERAPARLALGIMARLAATMRPEQVEQSSSLALAMALSLAILIALPVLALAISLMLSAMGNPAALNMLLQQLAHVLALIVAILEKLVEGAQTIIATYPQAPLLMISVLPILVFWLLKFFPADPDDSESGGSS